jgi:hypothetical protein
VQDGFGTGSGHMVFMVNEVAWGGGRFSLPSKVETYGDEMSRFPHCLDNGLTDSGKAVIPTHRPRSTPQKQYFLASGTHFCLRLSEPQGLVRLEGLGILKKKIIHLFGTRTRGL